MVRRPLRPTPNFVSSSTLAILMPPACPATSCTAAVPVLSALWQAPCHPPRPRLSRVTTDVRKCPSPRFFEKELLTVARWTGGSFKEAPAQPHERRITGWGRYHAVRGGGMRRAPLPQQHSRYVSFG